MHRRMYGGGRWRRAPAHRAGRLGGNTPQTPTLWPRECAAEVGIADGTGTTASPRGEDRSIGGAPQCAQSGQADWGWFGRGRGSFYKRASAKDSFYMGGHGRGHVVHDHGKDDERITPTGGDGCIRTIAITSGCTLSHNRNQDSTGGKSSCEPVNVNRNHLIKAGRGGDWARLSSKPGSPTTLSKIFGRCAATVSCGQYDASQLDGLRTERRTVVGTVRSVDVCSILLMNHDLNDAQCGSSAIEYLSVGKRRVPFELFVPAW